MRARKNQVSIPNPEFGMDFDASARAMHQSASMGSPMVHGKALSMPAASEEIPRSDFVREEHNVKNSQAQDRACCCCSLRS
jgi:hypothetical protein